MKCVDVLRSAAAGALAFLLLGSGSCVVEAKYCSDDCDPCVEVCTCKDPCPSALANDAASAYRMKAFVLTHEEHPTGAVTRTYSGFVGLSLDRAFGPGDHDARTVDLYARNVIARNAEFLGHADQWSLVAIERSGGGWVATFAHAAEAEAALEFLFDREGNLLGIARHGAS